MTHNHSQRVVRAEVMAAPAERFVTWYLAVECRSPRCPVGRHWPVRTLLELRRSNPAVADLMMGLRCLGCRERPKRVALVEQLPQRVSGRVLRLVGSGAYG